MRQFVQSVRQTLMRFRPGSIRGQILAFALLAALVPSLIISIIAYAHNRSALTEKITRELMTTGTQAGLETDVWLKERLYDLRVFGSSYVVSETLAQGGGSEKLAEYLGSVRARFSDYDELQLIDAKGRLVGSSTRGAPSAPLPEAWPKTLESFRSLVGEPYWDENARKLMVVLGVPVERSDGQISGVLLARASFAGLAQVLRVFGANTAGRVYLTTGAGRLIADSRDGPAGRDAFELGAETSARLVAADGGVIEFHDADGAATLASARRVSRVGWLAVADLSVAEAYRQAIRLRDVTLLVVGVLLVIVTVVAYRLAVLITRPLAHLTSAAAKVSDGDLSVDLPSGGSGEVAYLNQVFNAMVESLRSHRAALERLSTTDALTGLTNRRQLTTVLALELDRSRRNGQSFSILMLDVDSFKKYNDDHGHQAGDEVLARVGAALRESIRTYDCAARYGGEEFLVLLSGTTQDKARAVAERIRNRIRGEQFRGGRVTISIGAAEYPAHGDSTEAVIGRADAALYEAKHAGRDRVVTAGTKIHEAKHAGRDRVVSAGTKTRKKK